MSPTLEESSVLQCFECGNSVEIRNGIMFTRDCHICNRSLVMVNSKRSEPKQSNLTKNVFIIILHAAIQNRCHVATASPDISRSSYQSSNPIGQYIICGDASLP